MENAQTIPAYTLTTTQRFLLAFLIGLPTSFIFPFFGIATPFWWRPEIPLLILAFTMLLSIVRDPRVRVGKVAARRARGAMLTVVLLMAAFYVTYQVLPYLNGLLGYLALALVPVVVGLTAAFSVVGDKTKGYGPWCGFFAWLGAALVNIIASIYDSSTFSKTAAYHNFLQQMPHPGASASVNIVSVLTLILVIAHLTGLGLAVLGGDFGWRLRTKLLGDPRAVEKEALAANEQRR